MGAAGFCFTRRGDTSNRTKTEGFYCFSSLPQINGRAEMSSDKRASDRRSREKMEKGVAGRKVPRSADGGRGSGHIRRNIK